MNPDFIVDALEAFIVAVIRDEQSDDIEDTWDRRRAKEVLKSVIGFEASA